MPHVFISYVNENNEVVRKLADALRLFGIDVWLDRDRIKPGWRWERAIRQAIRDGLFFIACFSRAYNERSRSYMNKELNLAIQELQLHPVDSAWFIPVLIDDCEVPDLDISASETLHSIQWVKLYEEWN